MPATAADVPVELFDLILSFYSPYGLDDHEWINSVPIQKGKLSALSLVCRTWASICQQKLFEVVTLWNLKDAETLLELMNHPASRIGGYLRKVVYRLSTDNCKIPWVHTACRKLAFCPKLTPSAKFHLYTSEGTIKQLAMALSNPLPRCIRAMCIHKLTLKGVKVGRIYDLASVLNALPCLEKARLWGLSWTESRISELPAPVRSSLPGECPHLRLYHERVPGQLGRVVASRPASSEQDVSAARGRSSGFVAGATQSEKCAFRSRVEGEGPDLCIAPVLIMRFSNSRYPVDIERGDIWTLQATLASAGTSPKHVQRLRFNIVEPGVLAQTNYNWGAIDSCIIALNDLDEVEFRFSEAKGMMDFAGRTLIALRMLRLHCSSRLRFTLVDEDGEGDEQLPVCQTDTVHEAMERWIKAAARKCEWSSRREIAFLNAYREGNLETYTRYLVKLFKVLGPDLNLDSPVGERVPAKPDSDRQGGRNEKQPVPVPPISVESDVGKQVEAELPTLTASGLITQDELDPPKQERSSLTHPRRFGSLFKRILRKMHPKDDRNDA
ncbi:hypothetical protein NM688_g7418 [Phlebia brevispora]|uniref:Uncharacterized protein n=1 Tax=Phlebia brevispora TaxID=194682 RepID=A0ACC1S5H7_9APHY|nr:hypothetical protein NM688_g7418 [Phlebia brevispora]